MNSSSITPPSELLPFLEHYVSYSHDRGRPESLMSSWKRYCLRLPFAESPPLHLASKFNLPPDLAYLYAKYSSISIHFLDSLDMGNDFTSLNDSLFEEESEERIPYWDLLVDFGRDGKHVWSLCLDLNPGPGRGQVGVWWYDIFAKEHDCGFFVVADSFTDLLQRQERYGQKGDFWKYWIPYWEEPEFVPLRPLTPGFGITRDPTEIQEAKRDRQRKYEQYQIYLQEQKRNPPKPAPPRKEKPKAPLSVIPFPETLRQRLESHDAVEFGLRTEESQRVLPMLERLHKNRQKKFSAAALFGESKSHWEQLTALYQRYEGLRTGFFVFPDTRSDILELNANERLIDDTADDIAHPYLNLVYPLATSLLDSNEIIAIDLNPERFGWIGFLWFEATTYEGGYPVVAKSLFEFLERTLEGYEKGWRYYWDDPAWEPRGHLIPDDGTEISVLQTGVTWNESLPRL